jgi:alpha-beta hydrolase superfamily lysophospholipase
VSDGEPLSYQGAGGTTLRYRVIRASPERHVLLYLHGIESHGAWFLRAARGLAARGCTTWLLDRRGSGLNRDGHDDHDGDAESAEVLLEDVRRFRAHAGLASVVLVGLSWGGKLAVAAALDEPAGVRALVLITPGLVPRVDLSLRNKVRALASLAGGGHAPIELPIEPEMFTRTPRWLDYIEHDPDRLTAVTARFLLASRTLDRRLRDNGAALTAPVLLLLAGRDRIIDNDRTLALLQRLCRAGLRVSRYEDSTHSIQFDDTTRLVHDVGAFLEEAAC